MPRPVDPALRRARRLQIIDAGLTAFAEFGYVGATTARICQIAGISSGAFFHHFPTKDAVLVATLGLGTEETREFFDSREPGLPPRQVILDYVAHAVADLLDPRAAGFIAAVGGLTARPEIAEALQVEESVTRTALRTVVAAAQQQAQVRTDMSADRVAVWVMLVIDGFAGRIAAGDFDAAQEAGTLMELIVLLLDGPGASGIAAREQDAGVPDRAQPR